MFFITHSEEETKNFGKKISKTLKGGNILLLSGALGAGKTTLIKGIAQGLGVKENITSPTFVLMNAHKINNSKSAIKLFVHIDTYRLKNEQESIDIGAEDYLGRPDVICVIEWPEKIKKLLKNKKTIAIAIEHEGVEKNHQRKISHSN